MLPKMWMLLDSESTVNAFSNPELVSNISEADSVLETHCNTGRKLSHQCATYDRLDQEVWFDKTFIVNILSLTKITEKYQVTFNNAVKMSSLCSPTRENL